MTNSFLYRDPLPEVFSLTITKAAQRSLVEMMAQTFAPQGVHVGLISVGGPVAPEKKVLNPTNIAEKTWEFFENGKNDDLEVGLAEP